MQDWQIATIVVLAIIILVAAGWLAYRRTISRRLRHYFGPEYDRTLAEFGDRRRAEAELIRRQERVRAVRIRPLSASVRILFSERWRRCQAQFVDDPSKAVDSADRVLSEMMRARGYSAANPNERAADISAAYPQHAGSYRHANEIVNRRSQAATEDLRKAFIFYRQLFDQILGGYDEQLKRAS